MIDFVSESEQILDLLAKAGDEQFVARGYSYHYAALKDFIEWGRSIAARVEKETIKRCLKRRLSGKAIRTIARLYAPKERG